MDSLLKDNNFNVQETCCLCLSKKQHLNLLSEGGVADMLLQCASIRVSLEEDVYFVCDWCTEQINHWYVFKRQVERNFEICRRLLCESRKKALNCEKVNVEKTEFCLLTELMIRIDKASRDPNFSTVKKSNSDECKSENCKVFECSKCTKVFKRARSLTDHMKRHYDFRNFSCSICKKRFYKQYSLSEHMRVHTGERPFKCDACQRTFTRSLLLRNHIKKEHTYEKYHVCGVCEKSFIDGYQLKMHMRIHTGEKPFRCIECDKTFAMQGQLKSHIKYRHTLEKNFICNVCARSFTAKYTLEQHLATHTGKKREPRHTCNICGKKCLTTTQLKHHNRSAHTGERPFNCHVCSKRFITKAALVVHMVTHTGEKSFMCDECGKAFTTKSTLKTHGRIHSGERPYKCSLCTKSFTQGSTLKTHMKIHAKT